MDKDADAYRTISEVAQALEIPPHVLRFWETKFPQIKPLKRGGGRRYYRRSDTELLRIVRRLLYEDGYTIRGVQRLLKTKGGIALAAGGTPPLPDPAAALPVDELIDEPLAPAGIMPMEERAAALAAEVAACRAILTEALDAKGRSPEGDPPS